jgi:RimJ/RimL family protein N-acetyltransferase
VTLLEEERATETAPARIAPSALRTARLVLRPPQAEDARAIATLANDIRIAQNTLRLPYPYAVADAHAWLRFVNGAEGEATYLVTLTNGTAIGACGVDLREGQRPELGYWLGTHYWGHGYATEAARAVIDHAFGELGCEELQSGARVSNPASRRVLEKCGFQWSGVGLYRIRSIASSAPIDRFRLDRGIWSSLKSWGKAKRNP